MKRLKINANRIILIVCVVFVAAIALSLAVNAYRIYRLPESHVEVSGSIVDNRYNNFISEFDPVNDTGDLVRIGDKLYYNYFGSYASYGLYEISSNGARRIHWDGHGPWAFLVGADRRLYPIQEHGGKLLMNTIGDGNYYVYNNETKEWELAQGRIQTYCEETKTFEEAPLFGGVSDIHTLTYQETSFGFVYESAERYDLWVYTEEGGAEEIITENVCSFYAVGEQIYYVTTTDSEAQYALRMFDWGSHTDSIIHEWTEYSSMSYFIIDGDSLIFSAPHPGQNTNSIYTLDLRNTEQKEKAVYTTGDNVSISSWNVWNGTVYICTREGLIACNLDTGECRMLCEKNILECDIVDDTWVYFVAVDSSDRHFLWRVRQSGGNVELVLE